MSIAENICPVTTEVCIKSYDFYCVAPKNGSKRKIELFRSNNEDEDDCVECYLCVLPVTLTVDLICFPFNWCEYSNCCYLRNNKIKPGFFKEKIEKNNEIGKKNIQKRQNLEKIPKILEIENNNSTENKNTDNSRIVLSSPSPSNRSIYSTSSNGSIYSNSSTYSNSSNSSTYSNSCLSILSKSDSENDCVFLNSESKKILEIIKECHI